MKSLMGNERKLLPFALLYSALAGFTMPLNGFLLARVIGKMTLYIKLNFQSTELVK